MSDISITYPINDNPLTIKKAIENMLASLNEYNIVNQYIGQECYHIKGTGIKGHVQQNTDSIEINISLGLMMRPMKTMLESEIMKKLQQTFG